MSRTKQIYLLSGVYTLVLMALSYIMQMYQLTYLEESYIMVYDCDYILDQLSHPGGLARIAASMCSQFFICRFAGPLIVGIIYGIIIFTLGQIAIKGKVPAMVSSVAAMPCLCLMLCLESSAFEFIGTLAMMLVCVALWIYTLSRSNIKPALGTLLSVFMYYAVGTASYALVLAMIIYELTINHDKYDTIVIKTVKCLIYPLACISTAYLYYTYDKSATAAQTFTPAMYYDMGSTYYMMLYAMCCIPIFVMIVALTQNLKIRKPAIEIAVALLIFALECGIMLNIYGSVHSIANYENQQQRFYARHGMWDKIIDMPYDGSQTPYTSYRFLALAKSGRLADEIKTYQPHISYLIENKPKVKRRDQQIYSDIWYECDYMAAARKAAFDTDIVTPGLFNPYETLKLAEINMAYGDYEVADKMLQMLEKTLYYKDRAKQLRLMLHDDEAIQSDSAMKAKRLAIPAENHYMSPKGIQRDLKQIIESNPEQTTAQQFYKAFLILTKQL